MSATDAPPHEAALLADPRRENAPSPSLRPHVPWQRRLQTRVLAGILLIAGLSLVAVVFATRNVVRDQSLQDSRRALEAARQAFYQLQGTQMDLMAAQGHLVVTLPVVRAALTDRRASQDVATISGIADAYARDLKASFCLVVHPNGGIMGRSGWPEGTALPRTLDAGIRSAVEGLGAPAGTFRGIVPIGRFLYLVTAERAQFGEETLGTFVFGYRLDDARARELASSANCEVAFLSDRTLSGTSLTGDLRRDLDRAVSEGHLPAGRGMASSDLFRLGGKAFVAGSSSISRTELPAFEGRLLLLQDFAPTQRTLDQISRTVGVIGLLVFALALTGGFLISRRVSEPLAHVAAVAEQVAAGDWEKRAPLQGDDEAQAMARAFNRMTETLQHYYREAVAQGEQVERSYGATMEALSRALDKRDNETEGHSVRVTEYAVRIGRRIGLPDAEMNTLHLGALLHDIGKIGIPDAILLKPGRLDDAEFATMKRHCEFGLDIVRDIPYLEGAAVVIACHHERYDGGGYPNGLAGDAIPIIARVFSIADTLDAMTSDRPYRRALSFDDAYAEIVRCSATQFDPAIIEQLHDLWPELQRYRRRWEDNAARRA